MARPKNVIELLRDLVAIPSVNPHGNPGTDKTGEEAMAKYLGNFLAKLDAEVTFQHVHAGRPNVLATFEPEKKEAQHVAFAPHTDTVSVVGMTIPPFNPEIRDGKLWGRGSSDTKGPMAASLWALSEWAQSKARKKSRVRWTYAGLMGEEAGNEGAYALAKSGFKADLVVVQEPTSLEIVHAHKGVLWIAISTAGRSCHGSTPERGDNAIYKMRRILEVLETRVIPALAERSHPVLGATTLNVGTIAGGSKVNIVPDGCTVECDVRLTPATPRDAALELIAREVHAVLPEAQVAVLAECMALDTPRDLPVLRGLSDVARGYNVAPWFCDAAVFAHAGSPSVAIGPGSIAQAHTKDEFIAVADVEAGAEMFSKFITAQEELAATAAAGK
ncbi:acetylornithine deacetylase [Verrucomicrobia bacterium LW23]|nr:acetylornithine deacetylase [Verrucomicrobia bacterium LW23]